MEQLGNRQEETGDAVPPHKVKLASASLRATSSMTAKATLIFGWDELSLLLLSVVLGSFFPLAVTSGIAVGAITCVPIGIGVGFGIFILSLTVLWVLTTRPLRQRLIPFARWLFKR
jgi:hypothetical protein